MFCGGSLAERCDDILPEAVHQSFDEIGNGVHKLYHERLQVDGMLYTQRSVLIRENLVLVPVEQNVDPVSIFPGIGNDFSLLRF